MIFYSTILAKKNFSRFVFLYTVFYLIGFLLGAYATVNSNALSSAFFSLETTKTAIDIISHNLVAAFWSFTGVVTFGLSTLLVAIVAGVFTGSIIYAAFNKLTIIQIVAAIIPHGIFEIPGFIFAGAAGLKSLEALIRHLRGGDFITRQDIKDYFSLVGISVILIVIAGFVEANITPMLVEMVR